MRKKSILLLLCCICLSTAHSASISLAQAKQVAASFFQNHKGLKKVRSMIQVDGITQTSSSAEGYLFAPVDDEGFVWIGGTDSFPQILGYSFQGKSSVDAIPPQFKALMQAYGARHTDNNQQGLNGETINHTVSIPPLLTTLRWQEHPFNGKCPYYTSAQGQVSDERCLVGCVATSLEQIMTYYKYPNELQDTLKGWATPHYVLTDVMPGTIIEWDEILNNYAGEYTEKQVAAVQHLSYYCGMACNMNYGLRASGANMANVAPNVKRVFGYKTARYYEQSWYSATQWRAMLHHELKHSRPILYAGHNVELSGHAFVLDGLDNAGFYHVNWGYKEDYNGYFNLEILNPFENPQDPTEAGRYEGFFCNQSAVFLHPDAVSALPIDTIKLNPQDVTVDSVRFSRNPDTAKYVQVDFYLTNHTPDTINYTFEIMTYLPSDTAVFRQAEYVGLTGCVLPPGVTTGVKAYCKFGRTGDFLLGISPDDIHITYSMPIQVVEDVLPKLSFHTPRIIHLKHNEVTIEQHIQNAPSSGWAGNLVTYSLFSQDKQEDTRHWTFLNLLAGKEIKDTITYLFLNPNTQYTLKVRCPWSVVAETSFTTPQPLSNNDIEDIDYDPIVAMYTLNGVCVMENKNNDLIKDWTPPYTGLFLIKKASGRVQKIIRHNTK